MKKVAIISKGTIAPIIISTLILFSLSWSTTIVKSSINDYQVKNPSILALTPHDPIEIISDGNFADYGFSGSGTSEDPYIIQEYSITTTSERGIFIVDTTKYFVIRDCYVDAQAYGIYIANIAEGTASIINNICIDNNLDGIKLKNSSGCTVTDNTCTDSDLGINLYLSFNSTLLNNTCTNNDWHGIGLEDSSDSTLINNTCTNNDIFGIWMYYCSGSTIANNNFYNNGLYIYCPNIEDYLSCTIENNTVNDKKISFYADRSNIIISEPIYGQLIFRSCSEITVINQELSDTTTGVSIDQCNDVTLENINFNNNYYYGTVFQYSSNITLTDNTFTNNNLGIWSIASSNVTLTNNTFTNNDKGFYLTRSFNATLINNTCINNKRADELDDCSSSTLINNTFYNNGLSISEDSLEDYLTYNVENNTVNDKKFGFYINRNNIIISEPIYGQLILINCTEITVINQELSNASTGLSLSLCENATLMNNFCNNNYFSGISMGGSSSATLTNNTCNNNGNNGITLSSSSNATLIDNTCINNYMNGIRLRDSSNATLIDNTCDNNYWDTGITLEDSSNATLINNMCSNNDRYGI